MKRVPYEEMVAQFARVLEKKGFTASDAQDAAIIFAQNSLAGVFSHDANRFPASSAIWKKARSTPPLAPPAYPVWAASSAGTATAASAR